VLSRNFPPFRPDLSDGKTLDAKCHLKVSLNIHSSEVDFINILRAAFTQVGAKSAIKTAITATTTTTMAAATTMKHIFLLNYHYL